MKKILSYLREFSRIPMHKGYLLFILVFTASGIALYYSGPTLPNLKNSWRWEVNLVYYYLGLYGVPLIGSYLAYSLFYRRWDLWKNKGFLSLIVLAVATFTFRSCVHLLSDGMLDAMRSWAHPAFWFRIFQGIIRGLCILVPLTVYWAFVHRREEPLYGFTLKGFDTKPYFFMLLIMVPLIVAASLSADFLGQYPRAGNWGLEDFSIANRSDWKYFALFELIYGLDFINIEFFFRGFLVLAFMRFAGPHVIFPMAVFYVFIHFGKPLGETISSFFGGTLLGIISYYSRSIFGGIIVHMGIAWLMEIGALISKMSQ